MIRMELESDLLGRNLAGRGWGNWWQDTTRHDRGPNVFTTAMVVLSFTLFRPEGQPFPPAVLAGVQYLEDQLDGRRDLSPVHASAALAAVASVRKQSLNSKRQRALMQLCSTLGQTPSQPLIHFYDFECRDSKGDTAFERDYFIVPCGLVLGIGVAYGSSSGWRLHVQLQRITEWLVAALQTGGGVFKAFPDQYASTKDQAWVALFMAIASGSRGKLGGSQRFAAAVLGRKRDTWWWSFFFPITLIMIFGWLVFEFGLNPSWGVWARGFGVPDWLVHLPAIFFAAIEGAILHHTSPRIARKLLPGY
jgi:hypothetical protein